MERWFTKEDVQVTNKHTKDNHHGLGMCLSGRVLAYYMWGSGFKTAEKQNPQQQ